MKVGEIWKNIPIFSLCGTIMLPRHKWLTILKQLTSNTFFCYFISRFIVLSLFNFPLWINDFVIKRPWNKRTSSRICTQIKVQLLNNSNVVKWRFLFFMSSNTKIIDHSSSQETMSPIAQLISQLMNIPLELLMECN